VSQFKLVFGVGGVPANDNARAYRWEHRLRWIMAGIALLCVPAFYLEDQMLEPTLRGYGLLIELFIVAAFAAELGWMLKLVDQRALYLRHNWLDVLIILCSIASFVGMAAGLVALGRLMRFTLFALLLMRAAASLRGLFLPGRVRYLLLLSFGILLLSGAGFYWLEPTVHSFGDGVWLAFVTGATVGYGDLVPTTLPARLFAVLSVLVGFTLLSLMTAYVASILIGEEEKRMRHEMHRDIRHLRDDVARMVSEEELAIRRELQRDIRDLQDQIAELRTELRNSMRQRSDGN
jgi:voltage-gated potassium channel